MKILKLTLFFVLMTLQLIGQNPLQVVKATVTKMTLEKVTGPVRSIDTPFDGVIVKFPKIGYHPKGDWPLHERVNDFALPIGDDPVWQKNYVTPNRSANLLNQWEGLSANVSPGDPALDVGPNHVVQMINDSGGARVQVWDKSGNPVPGGNFLFDGVTGIGGQGDPIVIYDQLADRWLLSEFASAGNVLIVGISQTPDPTGGYFIYSYNTPNFPDYPKYGIWNNSYVVTTNELINNQTPNPRIYALDRTAMLAGNPAPTALDFDLTPFNTIGFQSGTPVNLDGPTLPPAGSPAMVMRMADDGWAGVAQDRLEIFELTLDFAAPASSSITGPINLPTQPFDTELNGFTAFAAIPQPGTGLELDPLREVIMNKIIYRNFGTHEALVCAHVTDVTGNDDAGVRWYELRKTGGTAGSWTIHQQGTYSPDNTSRWMASIGINDDGSIGLAYNVSDATSVFPGLRYTGRKECDPLGVMTFPETTIIDGSVASNSNRYGDYNTLSVDPIDGTFWFTGQYNPTANWATRVAQFEIPFNCFGISLSEIDLTQTVCIPSDAVYEFELELLGGFTGNVDFSATGLPAGTIATFDTNPASADGTYTMTVSGTAGAAIGTYSITITGTDGVESDDITVELILEDAAITQAPVLLTPMDVSTGQIVNPMFTWNAIPGATNYIIEIATDPAFNNIVVTGMTATNSYLGIPLSQSTQYFWRVRAENSCGIGPDSSVFSFETANISCQTDTATDTPIAIPTVISTRRSNITVGSSGVITGVRILNMNIQHTWIADLTITLTHIETGTTARLLTNICLNEDNIIGNFEDGGSAIPCPPNGGTYDPETPFSAFIGESLAGTWELEVDDNANLDGGSIVAWSLELCGSIDPVCPPNYDLSGVQSTSEDFETDGTFVSDQTIDSNATVDYDSGISVLLEDNFQVDSGVTFHAFIDGCMGAQ